MQQILGHHSILTTARYTHLTSHTADACSERLNTLMNGYRIWLAHGHDGGHRRPARSTVMMRLADLIAQFEPDLLARHGPRLLPSQRQLARPMPMGLSLVEQR